MKDKKKKRNSTLVPEVKPHKVKEFECLQSKYEHVPKLPCRSILYAPSGAGKSVLLQIFMLDIFRGCFARWYIFSPSVHLDQTWQAVKEYVRKDMGVDTDREQCFFDEFDEEALAKIIDTQFKVAEQMKQQGKHVYNVGIVLDDWADDPSVTRGSKLIHQLYVRGRHSFLSTLTSVQKCVTLHPLIRTQATHTFTFRLRS